LTKLVVYQSAASVGSTGATETLVCTGVKLVDTVLFVWNSVVGATPANCYVVSMTVSADDTLSVTWAGDPGAGAKVSVCVKKA
jgi:hypothetical protein